MKVEIKGLLHSIQRSLREEVRPELTSDHALAQLAGALDVLAKLEPLVDWIPALMEAQTKPLLDVLSSVQEQACAAGCSLQFASTDAEDRVRELIDLGFEPSTPWPPTLRNRVHALLEPALRESVAVQRRLISKTDFSSMTSTRK